MLRAQETFCSLGHHHKLPDATRPRLATRDTKGTIIVTMRTLIDDLLINKSIIFAATEN